MIFGSTHAQRKRRKQLDEIKKIYGAKKFAWFPIQLASGRYAWQLPTTNTAPGIVSGCTTVTGR